MVVTRAQQRAINDVPRQEDDDSDDGLVSGLDSRTNHLCDLVFGIDLLREIIIDYVILDSEGGFSARNALSCRLVQKSWRDSVFKSLVKSGKPLVELKLSLDVRYTSRLDLFLKMYKPSSPLPFKLVGSFYTHRFEGILKLLEKFLHVCGNGLVELELMFDLRNSILQELEKPLDDFRQDFTLPVLQKLLYAVPRLQGISNKDGVNVDIHIDSILQSILAGCLRLKHFKFVGGSDETKPLPESFGNLLLPSTITNLVLNFKLRTNHLELLMKNNMFPKLTDLTVVVPDIVGGNKEWIYAILDQVRCTLKNLNIVHGHHEDHQWYFQRKRREEMVITKTDPPVMKCLERIFIRSDNFEWADRIKDLHRKLPALRKIDLQFLTSTSLMKWVENSKFSYLKEVSIMFGDDNTPFRNGELEFLTSSHVQLMSQAFPKITKLEISTPCQVNVKYALQCLFESMTQLQVLTIKLRRIQGRTLHPRYLDAMLLGISCQLIEDLKAECAPGKLWDAVQLCVDKQFSLCNLSELLEFSLVSGTFNRYPTNPTFVSEKVKEFVVSAMPNLQKINLSQRAENCKNWWRQKDWE